MGGGSGGYYDQSSRTSQEAKDLFDKATKHAEQKVQGEHRVRNVFISFHHEDRGQVELLRSQAKRKEFGLEFRDHSIKDPTDEETWRREARERIMNTSATIVMIGPNTAKSRNVLYEIEESYRQGKKVIGVRIYGIGTHQVPDIMVKNKAQNVNWTMEQIQDELDKN